MGGKHPFGLALVRSALFLLLWAACWAVHAADDRRLAPGFVSIPKGEKLLVMPLDVELFSLSAGGVPEPKAEWTENARRHMTAAMQKSIPDLGYTMELGDESLADEFAEEVGLQAAVGRSIHLHFGVGGPWALPSKGGRLDWSFGDALRGIQQRTKARYALFTWVRDSYASGERIAMIAVVSILSMGNINLAAGRQQAHASLVDLETGRVLWYGQLFRGSGDLREASNAEESVSALLSNFPPAK